MSVYHKGHQLELCSSCDPTLIDERTFEREPRPRCREFCNIKECDPERNVFVCNYLEDRVLPKSPKPPRLAPGERHRMGIHDLRSDRIMKAIDQYDPDQISLISEDDLLAG